MIECVNCSQVVIKLARATDIEIYIGENFLSAYSHTLARHLEKHEIFKVLKEVGLCDILTKF